MVRPRTNFTQTRRLAVGTKRKCRNAWVFPKRGADRMCHPLPATAALDPKRTQGLPIVASVSKRKNVLNHSFGYLLSLFSAMTASRS